AGQSALVEATIDGALIQPLQLRNLPGPTVTRGVADPGFHPGDQRRDAHGVIMLEANGQSYHVVSGSVAEVRLGSTPVAAAGPPRQAAGADRAVLPGLTGGCLVRAGRSGAAGRLRRLPGEPRAPRWSLWRVRRGVRGGDTTAGTAGARAAGAAALRRAG